MEPFVEQHMEDREVRKREEAQQKIEEAMAKSRERRNEQLAEQIGLTPLQTEQLAKVRADFKQRRNDLYKAGAGIAKPQELPEKLNAINEEENRLWPASRPLIKYKNTTNVTAQFGSLASPAMGRKASPERWAGH